MTNEQKAWLDANPDYRPISVAPGGFRWAAKGTLRPDGTFASATKRRPVDDAGGSFGVGKLVQGPVGGAAMAADDPRLLTTPSAPGLRRSARRLDGDDAPAADDPEPADPRGYAGPDWQRGGGGLPSQGGGAKR